MLKHIFFSFHQLPPGVSESHWKCLKDRSTPVEEVGRAVANIISDLFVRLHQQLGSPTKFEQNGSAMLTPEIFEENEELVRKNTVTRSFSVKNKEFFSDFHNLQSFIHPSQAVQND